VLDVHRSHLLQARLGPVRFREEFEAALASYGPYTIEPAEKLGLKDLYIYDDEATRRFKRLLNFELPYAVLDTILRQLLERHVGPEGEACARLYLSADDLRRCEDAGLEIGVHGHRHLVQSRLSEADQRSEVQVSTEYFRRELGFSALQWSYPYSAAGCWNETTKQLLDEFGFVSATTKVRAIVKPSDLNARWEIPRFDVRDIFDRDGNLVPDRLQALFVAD
jgi:peptidoglycan/xylan/chitin deacetylase (PgdA/CDA1 family)